MFQHVAYNSSVFFFFSFFFSQKWIPGPFTYLDKYPSSKKHLQFPKCIYFASIQQFPFLLDYLWELVYDEHFNFLASHYLFELDIFFLIDVFSILTSLHSYNTWFSTLVTQAYCQHSTGISLSWLIDICSFQPSDFNGCPFYEKKILHGLPWSTRPFIVYLF